MHFALLSAALCLLAADDKPAMPQTVRHQVTGLFSPDRVDDLREAMVEMPDIKLISVEYDKAEAVFEYDPAKAFVGAKPDQVVERFNNTLRGVTRGTFGIKPLAALPPDKLQRIEISVVGLDCKGCSLGAYEAVYKLDGVERATASFKTGLVIALVDPTKTNRAALEEALKQRRVELK